MVFMRNSIKAFSGALLACEIFVMIDIPAQNLVASQNVSIKADSGKSTPSPLPNVVIKRKKKRGGGGGSSSSSPSPFGLPPKVMGQMVKSIKPKGKRRKKLKEKGDEPEEVEPTDPSDDIVDASLTIEGWFMYEKNPCKKYKENKFTIKNYSHKKGCKKVAKRLKKYSETRTLPNCPDPGQGRCFQFEGHSGRCYVLINQGSPRPMRKFVLVNNCFYGTPNVPVATPPPVTIPAPNLPNAPLTMPAP